MSHYCCKSCGQRYDVCACLPAAIADVRALAEDRGAVMRKSIYDLLLWPDGTWCEACDLDQYAHMSDDFERIPHDSVRAASLRGELDPSRVSTCAQAGAGAL